MRIISGTNKGKKLYAPEGMSVGQQVIKLKKQFLILLDL